MIGGKAELLPQGGRHGAHAETYVAWATSLLYRLSTQQREESSPPALYLLAQKRTLAYSSSDDMTNWTYCVL